MKRKSLLIALIVGLSACGQQDPYKDKGSDWQDPNNPKDREQKKPEEKGALALYMPDDLLFVEGSKGEYDVKFTVPSGGSAAIEFKDLPKGVVYNATTKRLEWTPDYQAANDPNNPAIVSKTYYFTALVYDTRKPVETIEKRSRIIVNDTARPAGVKSGLEMLGLEGTPMAHIIEFEDQEYPAGPFDASVSGLPLDVVVDWPNKTQPRFLLRWTPGYDKIINRPQDTYTGHVTIYNPRGKRLEFNVVWTVSNRVIAPIIAGPTSVSQPVDVDFVAMAEDLNNEYIPQWTAIHPGYGILTVNTQTVVGAGRPKSAGIVSWKNIPPAKLGIAATVQLRACVQTSVCTTYSVQVLPTAARVTAKGKK